MADLKTPQRSLPESSIPAKWLNEDGELNVEAVTRDAHRLRGETMAELLASLSHWVKEVLRIGSRAAHG